MHRTRTTPSSRSSASGATTDLPDVDIRVGASVLDGAIAEACARPGAPAPVIISDGGPYRTAAGPVVDRLAKQLGDCPVIQLGTGTVRADEETVERAVAEVGSERLLISVGRRHAHRHREGSRTAHR